MFKKSTIVLIATSVAFWIALTTVVAVVAMSGVPYSERNIDLSEGTPAITKDIARFKKLKLNSSFIVFSKSARIQINQCDTISAPRLVFPEAVDSFLTYSMDGDTLDISFICSGNDVERYNTWFVGGSPLTIITPAAPQEIEISSCYNPFPITLSNIKAPEVRFRKNGNMTLDNCRIDSLILNFARYYDDYSIKINDSEICVLKPDFIADRSVSLYVMSDSAATSTIRHFEWENRSDRKHELSLDGIDVNQLSYGNNSITLYLKNNATIGSASSK